MADGSAVVEKSPVATEGQSVPEVNPAVSPSVVAEKRHNFIYNIFHRKKNESMDVAKEAVIPVEAEAAPAATFAAKGTEPAPVKPLTPAEIKKAELEKKITEASKEDGLKVALEGRLEDWHTKISDWLIRTQGVPDPMSMRESLSRFGQLVMDPELQVEDSKRQGAEMVRDVLGVADKLVTSIRLRLGGPYSKGGQNGSNN